MDSITPVGYVYILLFLCGLTALVITGVVGFTVFILDRHFRTCPECRRRKTAFIVNTETTESPLKYDYRGNRPMRIQEIKTVDYYECDHCGHEWTRSFERTDRTPHKPMPEPK